MGQSCAQHTRTTDIFKPYAARTFGSCNFKWFTTQIWHGPFLVGDCESTCSPLGLNDCAKCIAHDLPTRERIELKESLVIQHVCANKGFTGIHVSVRDQILSLARKLTHTGRLPKLESLCCDPAGGISRCPQELVWPTHCSATSQSYT